jgi:hypothetical protein
MIKKCLAVVVGGGLGAAQQLPSGGEVNVASVNSSLPAGLALSGSGC